MRITRLLQLAFAAAVAGSARFLASATFVAALTATATPSMLKIDAGQCGGDPSAHCDADNGVVHSTAFIPILINADVSDPFYLRYVSAFNSWNASFAQNDRWSLFNTSLSDGSILDVSTYRAYVGEVGGHDPEDCALRETCGGAEIQIDYTPGHAFDPTPIKDPGKDDHGNPKPVAVGAADAVWSQAIRTSAPSADKQPGDPYLDNAPGLQDCINCPQHAFLNPPAYPFEYPGSWFYDKPGRDATADWFGVAFITQVDYTKHRITVYDGVEWGFLVTPVPEPGTVTLFGIAFVGFLFLRRRRILRPSAE